jgi:hypothetical protein
MNARFGSVFLFAVFLCGLASADQAPPPPAKAVTAEDSKIVIDKSQLAKDAQAKEAAVREAAAKEAAAKEAAGNVRSSDTTSTKQESRAASAEVSRVIRAGDVDAGRAIVKQYEQSAAPPAARADVSLTYGNELMRATRTGKGVDPAWYGEAKQQYYKVIEEGEPAQQLMARNNVAAIDLEQGDSASAIKVFEDGYSTVGSIPEPAMRSRYLFNYAQVLERASSPQSRKPADLYREAFITDPRRREAADAGLKLTLAQGNIEQAAGFAQLMIDKGHLGLADKRLREALADAKVRKRADACLLLGSLMNLIAAQEVVPREFDERWRPYVTQLSGLDSCAEGMRTSLLIGYAPTKEIPQVDSAYAASSKLGLQQLKKPQLTQVSEYLTEVGNVRAAVGDPLAAFHLYTIGSYVDRENMNAALYKANLLLERSAEIDPDGRLLNRFIDELFQGKGEAYLGEDWPGILQFHTILGTLYYRKKQWGDPYNPRSAVFQLEHADKARRRLKGKAGGEPAPGLYTMLAECYVAVGQPARAYDAYQQAARDALDVADWDLANDIMKGKIVSIGGYTPTPEQRAVSSRLEERIAAGPPSRG